MAYSRVLLGTCVFMSSELAETFYSMVGELAMSDNMLVHSWASTVISSVAKVFAVCLTDNQEANKNRKQTW